MTEPRNQVIAACGNGSLRLFDITLEVSLRSTPDGTDYRDSPSKRGMNIKQRSCLSNGQTHRRTLLSHHPGTRL